MFVLHRQWQFCYAYGFVKVDAEKVNSALSESESSVEDCASKLWKIYGLEEFLDEMGRDGRPRPSQAAIETLRQSLMEMSMPPPLAGADMTWDLMDDSAFEKMVKQNVCQRDEVSDESTVKCLLAIGKMS